MGIFNTLFRPYTKATSDILSNTRKISGHLSQIGKTAHANKERARLIREHGPKKSFDILYKEYGWDEDAMAGQIKGVGRAKWAAIIFLWIAFCITIGSTFLIESGWFKVIVLVSCSFMLSNSFIKVIKFSVFQAQLKERDLMSVSDFLKRKDKWARIFS